MMESSCDPPAKGEPEMNEKYDLSRSMDNDAMGDDRDYIASNDEKLLYCGCCNLRRYFKDGKCEACSERQSKQRTFCYCKNCRNELCGDPLTQCFDAGSEVHYICSKCRWQTDFLFDAPVPIFLRAYAPAAERQAKGEQR